MWTNIATISYSTAALAFFFLFVLLITSWRGRLYGMILSVACLLSAAWAFTTAINISWNLSFTAIANLLEILRSAGWSAFLIALIGPFQQKRNFTLIPKIRISVIAIAVVYLVLICYTLFVYRSDSLFQDLPLTTLTGIVGNVIIAIIGITLVEQFYRNSPVEKRWGIKFICLGIGAIFIYDFYLYSDALLFRTINIDLWNARGIINALVVPFIAISAARNPQWAVGISVSRQIIFYSAALFGTAAYLLIMAGVGYYLRFSGESWQGNRA
jgi:putative PEP-CTERM system histidine kinase